MLNTGEWWNGNVLAIEEDIISMGEALMFQMLTPPMAYQDPCTDVLLKV